MIRNNNLISKPIYPSRINHRNWKAAISRLFRPYHLPRRKSILTDIIHRIKRRLRHSCTIGGAFFKLAFKSLEISKQIRIISFYSSFHLCKRFSSNSSIRYYCTKRMLRIIRTNI